jgi:hypothetical protein
MLTEKLQHHPMAERQLDIDQSINKNKTRVEGTVRWVLLHLRAVSTGSQVKLSASSRSASDCNDTKEALLQDGQRPLRSF